MLLILAGLLMLAGGCRATPEEVAAADDARCQGYGAKPGTDIYVMCRMKQREIRAQQYASYAANRPRTCRRYGDFTVVCN